MVQKMQCLTENSRGRTNPQADPGGARRLSRGLGVQSRRIGGSQVSVIGEGVDLLRLVDKGVNAELYKQLGEWIDKVRSLQKDVDDLTATNLQLEERLRFKGNVQRIAGRTYVDGSDDEMCSRCAVVDFLAVPLLDMNIDGRGRRATCPQCKTARGDMAPPIPRRKAEENARRIADKSV
jgi:hypothetical protein